MTQGEEKTIPIGLPDDYRDAALAGKTVEIRLTAVEIKEKTLPELDDEFARAYEDADSLDLLRERLRSDVETAIGERADAEVRGDILKRLVDENTFDVPEILVHEQMRRAYLQGLRTIKGASWTRPLRRRCGFLDETFSMQAREVVRGQLILRHIGAQAGVTVTPEEVDAEIASLAARMAQNPEALKQSLQRNGALGGIENGLRDDKVFAAILADVQVSDAAEERPSARKRRRHRRPRRSRNGGAVFGNKVEAQRDTLALIPMVVEQTQSRRARVRHFILGSSRIVFIVHRLATLTT